jgi:hypothetical protein
MLATKASLARIRRLIRSGIKAVARIEYERKAAKAVRRKP